MAEIFRRIEKKYILNGEQYKSIIPELKKYMEEDQYGPSIIGNIYFDTDQYELIRHSITKPYYKEKIRLRSYNSPKENDKVYLEIKRKVDGVVGKRRIELTLEEFKNYINKNKKIKVKNTQIKKELDYTFNMYDLKPKMYISYLRTAFYEKGNNDFRATFDSNVIARTTDLNLESGSYGKKILEPDNYILEIKTLGAIPIWFVQLINKLEIKPGNFSKYGEAYEQLIMNKVTKVVKVENRTKESNALLNKVKRLKQNKLVYQNV